MSKKLSTMTNDELHNALIEAKLGSQHHPKDDRLTGRAKVLNDMVISMCLITVETYEEEIQRRLTMNR